MSAPEAGRRLGELLYLRSSVWHCLLDVVLTEAWVFDADAEAGTVQLALTVGGRWWHCTVRAIEESSQLHASVYGSGSVRDRRRAPMVELITRINHRLSQTMCLEMDPIARLVVCRARAEVDGIRRQLTREVILDLIGRCLWAMDRCAPAIERVAAGRCSAREAADAISW